jgi:hypothetical protein
MTPVTCEQLLVVDSVERIESDEDPVAVRFIELRQNARNGKVRCRCLRFRLSVRIEVVSVHRVGKYILEFVNDARASLIRKFFGVSGSIGVANLRTFF